VGAWDLERKGEKTGENHDTNTYLRVRELLRDDRSREEEELDLIPMHLWGIYTYK